MQILEKNLELAGKEATLAQNVDPELSTRLIEDALENEVSAFDSFGRETCRIHSAQVTQPDRVQNVAFQSLARAQRNVQQYFGIDITQGLALDDWNFAVRCFQKRHLLAHKMGVIDEDYVRLANDPTAIVGRKVAITADEVYRLANVLRHIGQQLIERLSPDVEAKTDGT